LFTFFYHFQLIRWYHERLYKHCGSVPGRESCRASSAFGKEREEFREPSGELPRYLCDNSDIPVDLVRNHIHLELRKDREAEDGRRTFQGLFFTHPPTGVILMVYDNQYI
jgi:hypothetical protein